MASYMLSGRGAGVLYRAGTGPIVPDGRTQFATRNDGGGVDLSIFLTPAEAAQWAGVLAAFADEHMSEVWFDE